MAEWPKAHRWKRCEVEISPWVRIPAPPPSRGRLDFNKGFVIFTKALTFCFLLVTIALLRKKVSTRESCLLTKKVSVKAEKYTKNNPLLFFYIIQLVFVLNKKDLFQTSLLIFFKNCLLYFCLYKTLKNFKIELVFI